MSRSQIIFASAFALAVGVLLFTIFFSPPVNEPAPRERPLADPTRTFTPLEKDKGERIDAPIAPSGVIEKYYIRRFSEERKQLTVLSGERATPKPNGVVFIEGITAHIHLIPGRRVVEIKGPRGTLVAPENNPESGVLTGGVVVTLFESPGDQAVNLAASSPDVKLRMYLDDPVRFDLVLGMVESDGPVHLTMPRADFRGTGLNLVYNERRRRINRLEILHGKEMRFNPNAPAGAAVEKRAEAQASPETKDKGGERKGEPGETDFYRATFEKDVRVKTADANIVAGEMDVVFSMENRKQEDEGDIEGARQPKSPAKSRATSTGSATATAATDDEGRSLMPASPDDVIVTWSGTLLVEPMDAMPAEFASADDTLLTLRKQVSVRSARQETITAEQVEYLGSAARVHIVGDAATPAMIESPDFGRLHVLDLVLHQKRGIGTITGPGAIVASANSVGEVNTINADGKPVAPPVAAKDGAATNKLPPGVSVSWTDSADLIFQVKEEKTPQAPRDGTAPGAADALKPNDAASTAAKKKLSPTAQLDALKEATFAGGVKVEHSQFDLASDRLLIAMSPAAKEKQEPQLVKATGKVQATARGDEKQPSLDIEAGDLEITFAPDSRGEPQPARMLATDQVKATQPGRVLTSGILDVTLAEGKPSVKPPATEPNNTKPAPDAKQKVGELAGDSAAARMTVKHMRAERTVRITMDEPRTLVTAERVEAEAAAGLLQIYGTDATPARVERVDDSLTGKHITLRESDQFVTVPGPGAAEFVTRSTPKETPARKADAAATAPAPAAPPAPAATASAPAEAGPPQRLKITWATAMDFNNSTGVGHFYGSVVANSERGVDLSRFQAGELTLELDPMDPKDKRDLRSALQSAPATTTAPSAPQPNPGAKNAAANTGDAAKDKAPARNVRKIFAQHKVVFEAEKWDDQVGGKLGTRFRLTGPLLTFDNTTEKLDIFGPGTMQLEDYRAKEKAKKPGDTAPTGPGNSAPATSVSDKPADAANPSTVAFVGNGVTLFLWQGAMSIDANHNDVRMEKEVRMLQQPASGSDIHMQCNQLIADFQSTGGLSSWLTGKANEPKLDNVTANGKLVIIYQKQTVRGDQLHYTGAKQLAVISAEAGKMCELDTEQTTLPARQFRWLLDKDRIVADEPGAVRAKTR